MQNMMNNFKQLATPQTVEVNVKIMKKLIEELERGKKSAIMIRNLILQKVKGFSKNEVDHQECNKALDHHSMMALDTYTNAISKLKGCKFDRVFVSGRRKLCHLDGQDDDISLNGHSTIIGRRQDYKRRKIGESREEEVTHLTEDGFSWRKYGQKLIYNSHHPRHYYRCINKNEQNCQATKQVQQVSDKPTKYRVIYHFNHTCNNNATLKTSLPYMIDDSPRDHPSTIVLSFDKTNPINPILFPASSAVPTAVSAVNQSYSPPVSPIRLSSNHAFEQIVDDFSDLPDWWIN